MKTRPESRQKEAGNDDESSSPSGKELEQQNLQRSTDLNAIPSKPVGKVLSSMRVKSAKSAKSISRLAKGDKSSTRLLGERSTIDLERKYSGRKKSGTFLSENTKNQVVRKFKGSRRDAKLEPKSDEVQKQDKNLPIWDERLEQLNLAKKTSEMIDKEIGLRCIRVIPATPSLLDIKVKRLKQKEDMNRKTLAVMRPASLTAIPIPTDLLGPRYDNYGKIVPHSILGDVDDFTAHAYVHQNKQIAVWDVNADTVKQDEVIDETSEGIYYPHVNERKALKTWDDEMDCRRHMQKHLADLLQRPVGDLLMYKSDSYNEKTERIRFIQHYSQEYHGDVCFWRLPDHFGGRQLKETITKSYRGRLPSPVISGDADFVLEQKGKTNKASVCGWARNEYSQKRIQDTQGVIKVSNSVLFAELDLHGVSISSKQKQIKLNEKGDDKDCTKGVHFMFQSITRTDQNEQLQNDALKHNMGCKVLPDTGTDKFVLKYTKHDSVQADVPALLIDDTLLQWRSMRNECNHSNIAQLDSRIIKEVFVLIKANVDEVVKGFAKIANCNNTAIRYCWLRVAAHRTLPVPRPKRRYFYFLDNEGVILPKETINVPMLFRSKTPGYFTESWLLSTTPPLERGAKVKFTFKGVAIHMPNVSQQVKENEDFLKRNQSLTLCTWVLQSVIDYATLTASIQQEKLDKENLDQPSAEYSFMQQNPKFYYHGNIVNKLQELEKSFDGENSDETDVPISNNNTPSSVSVIKLIKMIHSLPDDCEDDYDGMSEDSQSNESRKEMMLWQLNKDIADLGFRPYVTIESKFQYEYTIMYTLLQNSMDKFVGYACTLADVFGLIPKEELKNQELKNQELKNQELKNQEPEPKKLLKSKAKNRSNKGGKKSTESPELQTAVSTVTISPDNKLQVQVFSNAHKYRQELAGKFNTKISHYDEKVYLEMYSILSMTIDQMTEVFAGI